MRDSAENPYIQIVSKKEDVGFGSNWICEEFDTVVARTEKRKSRSHLFGLMRRCIETCEDEDFIQFLLVILSVWAEQAGDEFSVQQAEKAFAQLGIPPNDDSFV